MPSPVGDHILFDDFHQVKTAGGGACSDGNWVITTESGSSYTNQDLASGVLRLTTDTCNCEVVMVAGAKTNWRVQDGAIAARVRLKVDDMTNVAISVGFTDANTESALLPFDDKGGTLTTTATTAIGFTIDTDACDDGNWSTVYVDDDTDGAQVCTGKQPTQAKYTTLRVRLEDNGSGNQARAEFSINCNCYYEVRTATIDRDALLTPFVGVMNSAGSAHNLDIDYIYVAGSRVGDCG